MSDCVCRENDPCVFHAGPAAPKNHNVSEFRRRVPPLRMGDLEDIVYFFMNAPLEKNFSKDVLLGIMCKLNCVEYGDPGISLDIADWLARTEEKWRSRQGS